jgi:hypothetical protein
MAHRRLSPGCKCCNTSAPDDCTGSFALTVTVTHCGEPTVGATVTLIKDGVTHATGTTNGSGVATLTFSKFGTFTIEITGGPTGTATFSTTTTLTCANASRSYGLTVQSGYNCCDWDCYPLPIQDCSSVTLSDGLGSITLNRVGTTGCSYQGCALRTATADCGRLSDYCSGSSVTSGSVPIAFLFNPATPGLLTIYYPGSAPQACFDFMQMYTGYSCADLESMIAGTWSAPGCVQSGTTLRTFVPTSDPTIACGPPSTHTWTLAFNTYGRCPPFNQPGACAHPLSMIYGITSTSFTVTWCR